LGASVYTPPTNYLLQREGVWRVFASRKERKKRAQEKTRTRMQPPVQPLHVSVAAARATRRSQSAALRTHCSLHAADCRLHSALRWQTGASS